jgi:hypothetical protein
MKTANLLKNHENISIESENANARLEESVRKLVEQNLHVMIPKIT